jgi:hypothetical protein
MEEEVRPTNNGDSPQAAFVPHDALAVPVGAPRMTPAIARMRIFFGKKKSGFKQLTQPVRILIISAIVLSLVVAAFSIWIKPSVDGLAAASKISETSGSVAAPLEQETKPAETPPTETEVKEGETEQQATRNPKGRRRNSRAAQRSKRPSKIERAWEKTKKILNPF